MFKADHQCHRRGIRKAFRKATLRGILMDILKGINKESHKEISKPTTDLQFKAKSNQGLSPYSKAIPKFKRPRASGRRNTEGMVALSLL